MGRWKIDIEKVMRDGQVVDSFDDLPWADQDQILDNLRMGFTSGYLRDDDAQESKD